MHVLEYFYSVQASFSLSYSALWHTAECCEIGIDSQSEFMNAPLMTAMCDCGPQIEAFLHLHECPAPTLYLTADMKLYVSYQVHCETPDW